MGKNQRKDKQMNSTTAQQFTQSKLGRRTFVKASAAGVGTLALIAAGLVTPESTLAYGWSRTLKLGLSGHDVAALQLRIAGWAADSARQTYVAMDGAYGPATEAAVKRFQRAYGLAIDGIAGPQVQRVLNSLESADGSTANFNFAEFYSKDGSQFNGGKVAAATVKANVIRTMFKLEALRRKAGNVPVSITSGFRSIRHNASVGGASNSQHMYGIAADIRVSGKTPVQVADLARTCGFSGIIVYNDHNQFVHVDSRAEHAYGTQGFYWPPVGARE